MECTDEVLTGIHEEVRQIVKGICRVLVLTVTPDDLGYFGVGVVFSYNQVGLDWEVEVF